MRPGAVRKIVKVGLANLAVLVWLYAAAEAALHVISFDHNPLIGVTLRIPDPVFHHTLRANYNGWDVWGDQRYPVHTNSLGFKDATSRAVPLVADRRRVLFIGDSFTEGVGLPYEQTFVGRFAQAHPEYDVLNAGVVSYAPSAYFEKVNDLIRQGLRFDEVIVYIDISDVRDEAVGYCYDARGKLQMRDLRLCEVSTCPTDAPETAWWKHDLRRTFYVPDFAYHLIKQRTMASTNAQEMPDPALTEEDAVKPGAVYGSDTDPRARWTYDPQTTCFGTLGIDGGIRKAREQMDRLYSLLDAHDITLSVGIYPWPQQLLYDSADSLQVRLWRDWCADRCRAFYNHFPVFFAYKRTHPHFLKELFIWGDTHYSAAGNAVLANDLLAQYRPEQPR